MPAHHVDQVIVHNAAVEVHFVQRFDDVRQVVISRIGESLVKAARRVQRLGDVADVELEELLALRQIFDELYRCAAIRSPPSSQQPTHRHTPDVGAVCDFQRALVAFKVAEDAARHARHGVDRADHPDGCRYKPRRSPPRV